MSATCPACGGLVLDLKLARSGGSVVDRIKEALSQMPMTVEELERHLRVGRQSVSGRVTELYRRGVLDRVGVRMGSGGRPVKIYTLCTAEQRRSRAEGFAP